MQCSEAGGKHHLKPLEFETAESLRVLLQEQQALYPLEPVLRDRPMCPRHPPVSVLPQG